MAWMIEEADATEISSAGVEYVAIDEEAAGTTAAADEDEAIELAKMVELISAEETGVAETYTVKMSVVVE